MTWTLLHDLFACRPTPFTNAAVIKNARELPNNITSVDDRGYTPLHIAVSANNTILLDAIKALVDVYPSAVMAKDLHGDTPMHLALHPNTSLELIQVLLKACPNVVSEPNKEGLMPIHAACRYCCDKAEIIELLINAKPSVLRCRTKMGNLVQKKAKATPALVPNESFAKNNQHLVLAEVVSSSWRSSQVQNTTESEFEERSRQLRDGSYPLHIAIANGAPFRVIEKLATAAPDVLTMTDKFGRTCLHLAVANEATLNLESSTETLNSQETHSKQLQRITLDILELLHFMNRNQIGKQDKSKNLPLHTAMQGGRSVECVDFLIRGYPQAVDMRNIDGLTPSELARKQCDRINKSD